MIFRAAHVLDQRLQVQPDWAVHVTGERITGVGPAREFHGETCIDLGDALLMPALVNAHTHLELGFLAGKVPPQGRLADWLSRLLPQLRAATLDSSQTQACIEASLDAALHSGTTLIGDITRAPRNSRAAIAAVPRRPAVRSFGEVISIGTLRDQLDPQLGDAAEMPPGGERLAIGISPHAPYTVEPEALAACAARARAADLPLCIHAAESEDELRFTQEGRGPLRDFLEASGVWDERVPVPGCRPIEMLDRCGALGPKTLLAHCNYLSDADLEIIAKSRARVVYCPRTHAAFGHPPHPVDRLMACKVIVCLGTDSLASNPSMSILEELQYLHRARPDLDPRALLGMATIGGALALGPVQHPDSGVLCPGARADLIALGVPDQTRLKAVPEEVLVGASLKFVMLGGKIVRPIDR